MNPIGGLKLWGNVAFVDAYYASFDFIDGNGDPQSYTGKTPPNVPRFVGNAGASYRFATSGRWRSAHRSAMSATGSISTTTSSS